MQNSLGSLLLLMTLAACAQETRAQQAGGQSSAAVQADFKVLRPDSEGPPPRVMLQLALRRQAHAALDRRREAFEKRTTVADWQRHREATREFFLKQLGGLPDPTPLQARTVGKLRGDGYRLEKVIYESRPGLPVTATLYLPETAAPHPAVLIACGHSSTGKAAAYNQRMGILLARNGLAALCYDPIGQGERSQLLRDGKPRFNSSTQEHFLVGVGAILLGSNTATHRILDGIRGIDYLCQRDDIDAQRIGCTGCSGGGTLTSYIMALDDRVACAAPACYLTSFGQLLDTIGPQDAEQNIYGQLAFGMDHADYLFLRVPKPTLICATTGDFFSIEGTWDCFRQAKRVYTRYGFPERVDLVEAEGQHGIGTQGRTAMTRWMRRWLLGVDDAVTDSDVATWSVEDLQCTPDGQVLLLPDTKSIYDLQVTRELDLAERRREFWASATPEEGRDVIRQLAGIRPLDQLPPPQLRNAGRIAGQGYTIEKLVLQPESGILLPALAWIPDVPNGDPVLYLHGQGKHVEAGPGGELPRLVAGGHVVLALDLRGLGETRGEEGSGQIGTNWKTFYTAYLLGQSMVGMRAEDTLVAARYLATLAGTEAKEPDAKKPDAKQPVGKQRVRLIASGEAAIPALHAAALHPELFSSVTLRETITSWTDVVRTPEAENQLVNTVHAALAAYDLPNLAAICGPHRVLIERPVDARGRRLDTRGGTSDTAQEKSP